MDNNPNSVEETLQESADQQYRELQFDDTPFEAGNLSKPLTFGGVSADQHLAQQQSANPSQLTNAGQMQRMPTGQAMPQARPQQPFQQPYQQQPPQSPYAPRYQPQTAYQRPKASGMTTVGAILGVIGFFTMASGASFGFFLFFVGIILMWAGRVRRATRR